MSYYQYPIFPDTLPASVPPPIFISGVTPYYMFGWLMNENVLFQQIQEQFGVSGTMEGLNNYFRKLWMEGEARERFARRHPGVKEDR